ncbi:hypothetical protein, partial [Xenorhabdus bovienii]|uniref:hypothetical protein n=1 Tax=Xenorhabdus bovienii TaxID=40576 RepID=UPI0023B27863
RQIYARVKYVSFFSLSALLVGVTTMLTEREHTLRKSEVLWIEALSANWPVSLKGAVNFVPQVISGERYMTPRYSQSTCTTNLKI